MNRLILTVLMVSSIVCLSACSNQEIEVNQRIDFYTWDNELILTITDNDEITSFTENQWYEHWDYSVDRIPADAMKLCTYVDYIERNGHMRKVARETMYYDKQGYYMFTETFMGISTQIKMSDAAALHIIDLLGLNLNDKTTTFAIEHPDKIASDDFDLNDESYPFMDFTYEGMLDASKDNQIDICDSDDKLIQNITNNKEIYQFILSLHTSEWTYVDNIPDNASYTGSIIFYQRGRKNYKNKMMEQWRQVLFYDGRDYYIDILIANIGYADNNIPLSPERYLIPEQTGKILSEIINNQNED